MDIVDYRWRKNNVYISCCLNAYRINDRIGDQFVDGKKHVILLCMDGVRAFDEKQHSMLPIRMYIYNIPFFP
jgi:hypothetical protein